MKNTAYLTYDFQDDVIMLKHTFTAPYYLGFNPLEKVSKNFLFREYLDVVFGVDRDTLLRNGIPIHKNMIQAVQTIRTAFGKAIRLGSQFRTKEHELEQNRVGDSQHVEALAVDLNA